MICNCILKLAFDAFISLVGHVACEKLPAVLTGFLGDFGAPQEL